MNNELYHHGILGQKWGDRNGPPYPLNAKDKSYAERTAGNNINPKDVKKNMDYLDDKELQKAINRIEMQNRVSNFAKQESIINRGKNAVLGNMKTFNDIYNTSATTTKFVKKIAELLIV